MLAIHAASTLFMVGVIWFVQVVHYPVFADVGTESFAAYESKHSRLTTWVVMPAMLIEFATASALLFWIRLDSPTWMTAAGFILVNVIWLSTFFLQVPCHDKLATGFDIDAWKFLVQSNWIRTIAWSVRGLLAISLLMDKN